ncbi:MAG: NADH-quinone oxidoreductase subunit J [Bacteroidia bacterium]|nr:NADH-quinone oxidoreductase subunit J [Bacteroidia bacterium]
MVLATLSVFSALMVVLSKKPVHSVLYLIFCFFTIGGHYLLLNAQFLFAVHIIVYAGAIMVLFLFSLMFINMNKESEPHKSNLLKVAATLVAGCLLLVLVSTVTDTGGSLPAPSSESQIGTVSNLGKALYGDYVLPFEITSILLLAAMVGAVMLGKKNIE